MTRKELLNKKSEDLQNAINEYFIALIGHKTNIYYETYEESATTIKNKTIEEIEKSFKKLLTNK